MALHGRIAIVTGGGRGIGAACARRLASGGAAVAVCARSREQVETVASEIGSGAVALACDVTDEEAVRATVESVRERLGPVDILINNAGTAHSAPLVKERLEDWNRLFAVNATGAFLFTRAVLPAMIERAWGRVVNVASVSGLSGAKYVASYTASKHAMVGLTRAAAEEVAGRGVTVNAVCPGYVATPLTEESVARIVEKTGLSRDDALRAMLKTTGQARLIPPEEVAERVARLCAEDARDVNGETVILDGAGSRS